MHLSAKRGIAIVSLILSVCVLRSCAVIKQINLFRKGTWLTALHCWSISTLGEHLQILETMGVCAKVAFAIQNQRCLWNEAVYSQSYYRVVYRNSCTAYGNSGDLRRTLTYFFRGSIIYNSRHLANYLSERHKIWQRWGYGQSKIIPQILWTFVRGWQGPRDTMRRHASVLHWYTCKNRFSTTSLCSPIVLVFFLFSALPED